MLCRGIGTKLGSKLLSVAWRSDSKGDWGDHPREDEVLASYQIRVGRRRLEWKATRCCVLELSSTTFPRLTVPLLRPSRAVGDHYGLLAGHIRLVFKHLRLSFTPSPPLCPATTPFPSLATPSSSSGLLFSPAHFSHVHQQDFNCRC